ncbi:MAG: xanthine dehydrogenase family protein molybdopterin-binding subunit [Anaerolineae bacterium]
MTTNDGASGAGTRIPQGSAYRVVGSRPVRHDASAKLTGAAIFATDVKLPGMVPGLVLRSPHAHAVIRSIDTSKAEALPGVLAVITAKDLWPADEWGTEIDLNLKFFRDNYLASDKVLHRGHPVAAVAAVDRFVAEAALGLIEVEYEPLPPVLDVLEAMKADAPLLHERLETQSLGAPAGRHSNVALHLRREKGDLNKGFAAADVVVEREFRTSTVHQGYLEPHATVAAWAPGGSLTLWSGTQGHFWVRRDVAQVLRLPVAKVNVVAAEVGGGFGGKAVNHVEPLAALLALKAGRPVRLVMSRTETFEGTGPTPASYMRVKVGTTSDGVLTAVESEIMFEAGAYPGADVGSASLCMFAPYEFPHGRIDAYDVVVNKPKSAAYRAPCVTQTAFAAESVMDEVAERLGMDPLAFRLKNAGREGTEQFDGLLLPAVAYAQTIRAAMEHPHYSAPLGEPSRGRGVACGSWFNAGMASTCTVGINDDGTVNLGSGSVDLQGNSTGLAMQVAEKLGIDLAGVQATIPATDAIGFTDVTGGSRVTFATGIAAVQATQAAIDQMCERAALLWGVPPAAVAFAGGVFTATTDATRRFTFKELAARLPATGGPVFASAAADPAGAGPAFALHIADVEVDPQTGFVRVLRYTAFQDVGTAIHPGLVEGQIQGGVGQGTGWALYEAYRYDEAGRLQNNTLLDYKLPTALDLPPIDVVLIESVPNPSHPYGVRGVGEAPIVPPPAALANAVYRATGARLRQLPLSPDRILQAKGVLD